MKFSYQDIKHLLQHMGLPVLVWTVLVASMCGVTLTWDSRALVAHAEEKARYISAQDTLIRQWNASHGGGYVPHSHQGYASPDVRGELSVSATEPSVFDLPETTYKVLTFAVIWLVGICGLVWWNAREKHMRYSMHASEQHKKQIESNLRLAERYDRATHLPNRRYLLETLENIITSEEEPSPFAAVMLIEFPDLPRVQRAYSNNLAALLLRKAAERISGCLLSRDLVARVNEHRLGVVLRIVQPSNLQAIADKIAREFEAPLTYEDDEFQLMPVFGAASAPDEGTEADVLFSRAVTGLEIGVRQSHQQVGFAPASNHLFQRRIQLEKDLRRAIRERELQVHYQPQIDIVEERVIGAEALVRWYHPQKGVISPAEFIPWLEEAGLMERLGEHVLRDACLQFVRLRELGYPGLRLSVNLSARQFRDIKLAETIDEILQESGMLACDLELEITEGSFIEDFERTVHVMTELKSLGVRIAIDDFGTGFSSLSYLSKLHIDTLKIDRSFVSEIEEQEDVAHIVDAIVTLAEKLGFDVVAEGVESESQVRLLSLKGCRIMQGYVFAKPLAGYDLEDYIASRMHGRLQLAGENDVATA